MPKPPDSPGPAPADAHAGAANVRIRVWLPADWHAELRSAASAQGISLSDLLRILIRGFLRGRYES